MKMLAQPHRGHLWLQFHHSIKGKFSQSTIFNSARRLPQATITEKQNSVPMSVFCHHQLSKLESLRLLLHILQLLLLFPQRRKVDAQAGWKATMRDKPMPKASLEAQGDMLPNWPNLSPPATALENTCTCCCLWQLSCQLLLPAVTRVTHWQAFRHSTESHEG